MSAGDERESLTPEERFNATSEALDHAAEWLGCALAGVTVSVGFVEGLDTVDAALLRDKAARVADALASVSDVLGMPSLHHEPLELSTESEKRLHVWSRETEGAKPLTIREACILGTAYDAPYRSINTVLDMPVIARLETPKQRYRVAYELMQKVHDGQEIDGLRLRIGPKNGRHGREIWFEYVDSPDAHRLVEPLFDRGAAPDLSRRSLPDSVQAPDEAYLWARIQTQCGAEGAVRLSDRDIRVLSEMYRQPGRRFSTASGELAELFGLQHGTGTMYSTTRRFVAKLVDGAIVDNKRLRISEPHSRFGREIWFELVDGDGQEQQLELPPVTASDELQPVRPTVPGEPEPPEDLREDANARDASEALRHPTAYTQFSEAESVLWGYFIDHIGVQVRAHDLWTFAQDVGLDMDSMKTVERFVTKIAKDPLLGDVFTVSGATYVLDPSVLKFVEQHQGPTQTEPSNQDPDVADKDDAVDTVSADSSPASGPPKKDLRVIRGLGLRPQDEAVMAIVSSILDGVGVAPGPSMPLSAIRRAIAEVRNEIEPHDEVARERLGIWQQYYDEAIASVRK